MQVKTKPETYKWFSDMIDRAQTRADVDRAYEAILCSFHMRELSGAAFDMLSKKVLKQHAKATTFR